MNPALVLVGSLAHHDLDVRIIEALPWLLAEFADLDTPWIVSQTRLLNLQNRVGYLVTLADQGATPARHLSVLAAEMESSRLASEGTLCRDSMPTAERTWVRKNRPALAAHWRLLTTLTREQLSYAL